MFSSPKPLRRQRLNRRGITMLELVIAGGMIAGVMAGLSFVMRTSRQSWEMIDDEYAVMQQMQAVARHFVRSGREANGVESIAADGTAISLRFPDDQLSTWNWVADPGGRSGEVRFQTSGTPQPTRLASQIDRLRFAGFAGDGVTATSDPENIHVIEIAVAVTVPRSDVPQKTVRSKVWIRSW